MRLAPDRLWIAAGACACAMAQAQDWPQYGGGPQRLSISEAPMAPRVGWVRWSVTQVQGQPLTFPNPGGAVASAGGVYAVGVLGGAHSAVAVDGATGAVRWAAPVPAPLAGSWSTPAVDAKNGVLIVAAGMQLTALRLSDGSSAWMTPLARSVVNVSPCITLDRGAANRVLITDYAPFGVGSLYCINIDAYHATANPYQPGQIVWSIPIGATSGNSAAYLAGRIYIACVEAEPSGPGAVMCYELSDQPPSAPVWRRDNPAGQGYFGGVAVSAAAQRVYAASYGFSGGQFAGDLAVLNGQNGDVIWHAPCNRTDSTPVPMADGRVIVSGGIDGFGSAPSIQLFSATGTLIWDTALATWNDLNSNMVLDPGEYLRLGGWTHQPVLVDDPSFPSLVVGNLGTTVVAPTRLITARLWMQPAQPGFIGESTEGPGASPAVAEAQSVGGAFSVGPAGLFGLGAAACYANCDGSVFAPVLNVNDFVCFNNRFAGGDSYANCDASTLPPTLNVNDFLCFSNRYAIHAAGGCP